MRDGVIARASARLCNWDNNIARAMAIIASDDDRKGPIWQRRRWRRADGSEMAWTRLVLMEGVCQALTDGGVVDDGGRERRVLMPTAMAKVGDVVELAGGVYRWLVRYKEKKQWLTVTGG